MNDTSAGQSTAQRGASHVATGDLVSCSQCGQLPADLEEEDQPEVLVLAENFGEPWMYGVRCRICGRVAKGVGRDAALKRWQDGNHDGDMDEFGNEGSDE